MYTKLNRKNSGIIVGIPIWNRVAFARYHCGYDASFSNFPFQMFRGWFEIRGVLEISGLGFFAMFLAKCNLLKVAHFRRDWATGDCTHYDACCAQETTKGGNSPKELSLHRQHARGAIWSPIPVQKGAQSEHQRAKVALTRMDFFLAQEWHMRAMWSSYFTKRVSLFLSNATDW